MSDNSTDESQTQIDGQDLSVGLVISSLAPVSGLGLSLNPSGLLKPIIGPERRTDVRTTNLTGKDMLIKFHGSKKEKMKKVLENEMTKFLVEKPWDGLLKTNNYECEFWWDGKYARIFIYGGEAPRKDNRFEARTDGIFLVETDKSEYRMAKWTDIKKD